MPRSLCLINKFWLCAFESSCSDGWAKIIDCVIDTSKISIGDEVGSNHLYVGTDRAKQLNTSNRFGSNFDTDTVNFYYDGIKTVVTEMLTAEQVRDTLYNIAGVMKRKNML